MKIKKQFATSEAVLQRMWYDDEILSAAIRTRQKLNIPKDGFTDSTEASNWLETRSKEVVREDKFLKPFSDFLSLVEQRIPYHEHISWSQLKETLWVFIAYNGIDFESLDKFSAFEKFIVKNGEKLMYGENNPDFFENGVYLRIPTTASIPAIHAYINTYSKEIKNLQDTSDIKTISPKHLKVKKYFDRDRNIENLMHYPKGVLEKISGKKYSYKEELVCEILQKKGFSKCSPETIKKIYNRAKALRKQISSRDI